MYFESTSYVNIEIKIKVLPMYTAVALKINMPLVLMPHLSLRINNISAANLGQNLLCLFQYRSIYIVTLKTIYLHNSSMNLIYNFSSLI